MRPTRPLEATNARLINAVAFINLGLPPDAGKTPERGMLPQLLTIDTNKPRTYTESRTHPRQNLTASQLVCVGMREPLRDVLPPLQCRNSVYVDRWRSTERHLPERVDNISAQRHMSSRDKTVPSLTTCHVKQLQIPVPLPTIDDSKPRFPSKQVKLPWVGPLDPPNKPAAHHSTLIDLKPIHAKMTLQNAASSKTGTEQTTPKPRPPAGQRRADTFQRRRQGRYIRNDNT